MLSRIMFTILSILFIIHITTGQSAVLQYQNEECAGRTMTIRCPANMTILVRKAFRGVPTTGSACRYTEGDCIVEFTSQVACSSDTPTCAVFGTITSLSSCRANAVYFQVQYDCVPIFMEDRSKEYDICENTNPITSTSGIIRSPGYPSIKTTSGECERPIQIPSDKSLSLWLTDSSMSATSGCPQNYVSVTDSVQTIRRCVQQRIAYPTLCTPNVVIQYRITTALSIYRGMRMYFELVDRLQNDGCPNTNTSVTPVPISTTIISTIDPTTTTNPPPYALIGTSSPVIDFKLCSGESQIVDCPNNYGVAVIRHIAGISSNGQCDVSNVDKDCSEPITDFNDCKKSCKFTYGTKLLLENCGNRPTNYQFIEYQCIPTKSPLIQNIGSCPADGSKLSINIDGPSRFQNLNYPMFAKMNCSYRIITSPDQIIRFYSLDINMNDLDAACTTNKFVLREDAGLFYEYCNEPQYKLIYTSCSNEIDLSYIVTDDSKLVSTGAELYIEPVKRPDDWYCGQSLSTSTTSTMSTSSPTTPALETETTNSRDMVAQPVVEHDICQGKSLNYRCPTGYTFMIVSAFYGIKRQASNPCGFTVNDYTEDVTSSITACATDDQGCYLTFSTAIQAVTTLNRTADYLHITSQCVPSKPASTSSPLPYFDICNVQNEIIDSNGIITSPGFPTYTQTNVECSATIKLRSKTELFIWINQLTIGDGGLRKETVNSDEPDLIIDTSFINEEDQETYLSSNVRAACSQDYFIISAAQVNYVYCGKRKQVLNPICGNEVKIRYKSTSKSTTIYRGFKIYFESAARPIDTDCAPIIFPSSTVPPFEIYEPWAQNLEVSGILSKRICFGSAELLRCSRQDDYVLSIIDARYIVTGTGTCDAPSSNECVQLTSIDVPCEKSCVVPYDLPKNVVNCGNQVANLLEIHYECIPTRLPNNQVPFDICQFSLTNQITTNRGLIVSPKYPQLLNSASCTKRLQTVPGQLWQIFIIDLSIDDKDALDQCSQSSLVLNDGNQIITLCGTQSPKMLRVSCANFVDLRFVTSGNSAGYRGFKIYFEAIRTPDFWPCSLVSNATTVRTTTTTRAPPTTTTLIPPSEQIIAFGGTTGASREYCSFPFRYNGAFTWDCLRDNSPSGVKQPWCATTSDYDLDRKWGFCDLSVTQPTTYTVCSGQSQVLQCPNGYVIDILAADYAAKPDGSIGNGSCVYEPGDCFKRDPLTVQTLCAGKQICTARHYPQTLSACQRYQSAYLYLVYTCVPDSIKEIPSFGLCDTSIVITNDTVNGYITSPSYPSTPQNIDCTFTIPSMKTNQDIELYILDMNLNVPALATQLCVKDVLQITTNSEVRRICGASSTDFILRTCRSSITLQLTRSSDANGKGVRLYFQYRDRAPEDVCPVPITTPSPVITSSTTPRTTISTSRPPCYPYPCPRAFKEVCFPSIPLGAQSKTIECAANYKIVIHQSLYGVGASCSYKPSDCTAEAENIYSLCAGKQSCSIPFFVPVNLPNCNNQRSNYIFIEYQCLPTENGVEIVQEVCTAGTSPTSALSGILTSQSFPAYTKSECVNASITNPNAQNQVVIFYLLSMNLAPKDPSLDECNDDYLTLTYQCGDQWFNTSRLCGARTTEVLFETCTPTDKVFINYKLSSDSIQDQGGFSLLYHYIPYTPVVTTTLASTVSTTLIPGPGPLSTSVIADVSPTGQLKTVRCDTPGYVLIIHKVLLYTSSIANAPFSADECYEDRTNSYNSLCGAKTTCSIFPPKTRVPSCKNATSTYLYVEYQCLPSRPKLNLDICSTSSDAQRVQGGARVFSTNYVSQSRECPILLQSNPLLGSLTYRAFKLYILSLNLPVQQTFLREAGSQCGPNDPQIEIKDVDYGLTILCGKSHPRYVLETCSSNVEVRFRNFDVGQSSAKYTGFELYFESTERAQCPIVPSSTTPAPSPIFLVQSAVACASVPGRERVNFGCPNGFNLVFLQSHEFVTRSPMACDVSQATCHFPSTQPQEQCSGQETCSFVYSGDGFQNGPCHNSRPDTIQFHYQCLPTKPNIGYERFVFCRDTYVNASGGFIETENFPNSYDYGQKQCKMNIVLSDNIDYQMNKFSIYLYIVQLSLRPDPTTSDQSVVKCLDSITYTSGNIQKSLCGSIDEMVLEFASDQKDITLDLNMLSTPLSSDSENWQGARLFFAIGRLDLPVPPPPIQTTVTPIVSTSTTSSTTTTRTFTTTTRPNPVTTKTTPTASSTSTTETIDKEDDSKSKAGMIAGIVVAVVVVTAAIAGIIIVYRRRQSTLQRATPVAFNTATGELSGTTDSKTISRGGSIGSSQLRKPVTSVINPFYPGGLSADSKHETDA